MGAPFYFYSFVILLTVQSFGLSDTMGIYYTLYALISLVSFNLYKKNSFYRTPLMFIHLSYFLTYFVRPFVLWQRPEFFEFIDVTEASHEAITSAIYDVLVSYYYLIIGFVIVTKTISFEKKINVPVSKRFLLQHFTMLSIFGIFLSLLKLFLFFVLGIGAKGVEIVSPLAFVQRFIPEDLFFIVTIIALMVVNDRLTLFQRGMIAAVSGLLAFGIMVTGSKIFLMRLGFFYIAYLIFYDKKIPFTRFAVLTSLGMILVTASFVLSATLRWFNKTGEELNPNSLMEVSYERFQELDYIEINDMLTERLNGLDGQIVSTQIIQHPEKTYINELKKVFSLKETILRIAEGMIPGLAVATTPSAGVGVSWYIYEFDKDFIFAGAVGFTASFMFGASESFLPYALMLYGGGLALVFGIMKFLHLDLLQFALCALISFHIVMVTISGNFDVIFSQLFIKLLLIPIYGLMFVFIRQIFKYY